MSNTIGCPIIDAKGMECLIKTQAERIKELERALEQTKRAAMFAKLDEDDIIRALEEYLHAGIDEKECAQLAIKHVAEQLEETFEFTAETVTDLRNQMVWHLLDCVDFDEKFGVNQTDVLARYTYNDKVQAYVCCFYKSAFNRGVVRTSSNAMYAFMYHTADYRM